VKRHRTLQLPDSFAVHLQEHDHRDGSKSDGSLDAKDLCRAQLGDPLDLNVRCHEAGPVAAGRDPCADLTWAFWVAVEQVGVDGRCDDHDAEALQTCEDGEDHIVPPVLEWETEDEQAKTEN